MSISETIQLPSYETFNESISALDLPISGSELHGVMCGYLVGGDQRQGEGYLRALMLKKPEKTIREAARTLFSVYAVTEQQLTNFGFELQLLLPDDNAPLYERARAFSEWCEGFSQGMTVAGVNFTSLKSEEAQEAVQHITEFANLDYEEVDVTEEDERALMEVIEYTRMAILHLYSDIRSDGMRGTKTTH